MPTSDLNRRALESAITARDQAQRVIDELTRPADRVVIADIIDSRIHRGLAGVSGPEAHAARLALHALSDSSWQKVLFGVIDGLRENDFIVVRESATGEGDPS